MGGLRHSWLPPAMRYPDLPIWDHNFDNVMVRTVNAGWNALFTTDLSDFSFKVLAQEVGVTPPALYHHFPSISALGGELAVCAIIRLAFDMGEDLSDSPPTTVAERKALVREVIRKYLMFAEKRPRHLALMLSPQFADPEKYPEVVRQHRGLHRLIGDVLAFEIERDATPPEVHVFWSLLHGSAALIASGQAPHSQHVTQAIERYFSHLQAG